MEAESELVFQNGLPVERIIPINELLEMEDRLFALGPLSDSEPSSNTVYQPSSGNPSVIKPSWKKSAVGLNYRKKAVAFWKSGLKKRLSVTTVRNRFSRVTSERQLYHWARQINPDSRAEKLRQIFRKTKAAYDEAERNLAIIYDRDLAAMARRAAREVKLANFAVSPYWISKFKTMNRIVSRKITKFVSSNHKDQMADLFISAAAFVHNVSHLISEVGPNRVFNADQSGFQYEFHSGRSLRTVGSKNVVAVAQSVNRLTHSYTVMPIIDSSGQLVGPLFIVLQELTGVQFGPLVQVGLFTAPNIHVTSSRSGKMQREHLETWLRHVYFPSTNGDTVLVVDSWSTYKNQELLRTVTPEGRDLRIMTIPPKTTQFCQLLDVFFFRMYKQFVRLVWDSVVRNELATEFYARNSVLKLQSLAYNQFCAPRYRDLWSVGWRHPGYCDSETSTNVKTPVDFCLRSTAVMELLPCSGDNFDENPFLTCSWCQLTLCFHHFFTLYHFCDHIALRHIQSINLA